MRWLLGLSWLIEVVRGLWIFLENFGIFID